MDIVLTLVACAVSGLVGAGVTAGFFRRSKTETESSDPQPTASVGLTSDQALQLAGAATGSAISTARVWADVSQLEVSLKEKLGAIESISASSETVASSVHQIASAASAMRQNAEDSKASSDQGRALVRTTVTDMQGARSRTQDAVKQVMELSEHSTRIAEISTTIEKIAEQTNLLALNAAIEAARAGEQGRGFAVVADEVRNLAQRTATATSEVGSMISQIQTSSGVVADGIQDLLTVVDGSATQVEQIDTVLGAVALHSDTIQVGVSEIAEALDLNNEVIAGLASSLGTARNNLASDQNAVASLQQQCGSLTRQAELCNGFAAHAAPDSLHGRVFTVARATADRVQERLEQALATGELSESALFDRNHQPVPGTDPTRFKTAYDDFFDRCITPIQEPALDAMEEIVYAICADPSGYVPTHNKAFSKPLTGNPETDLAQNRSKRIFDDPTGRRCGAHTERMLVQTYMRDTGEIMQDLSVPVFVNGKHWGGMRFGYRANA